MFDRNEMLILKSTEIVMVKAMCRVRFIDRKCLSLATYIGLE